jgi:hypothetical protein
LLVAGSFWEKSTAGSWLRRSLTGKRVLLPPSQNICTCWLLRFTFDHSSYSKKIVKMLFIFAMTCFIIIYILSIS